MNPDSNQTNIIPIDHHHHQERLKERDDPIWGQWTSLNSIVPKEAKKTKQKRIQESVSSMTIYIHSRSRSWDMMLFAVDYLPPLVPNHVPSSTWAERPFHKGHVASSIENSLEFDPTFKRIWRIYIYIGSRINLISHLSKIMVFLVVVCFFWDWIRQGKTHLGQPGL